MIAYLFECDKIKNYAGRTWKQTIEFWKRGNFWYQFYFDGVDFGIEEDW